MIKTNTIRKVEARAKKLAKMYQEVISNPPAGFIHLSTATKNSNDLILGEFVVKMDEVRLADLRKMRHFLSPSDRRVIIRAKESRTAKKETTQT